MTAQESHKPTVVEEEQRVIRQALHTIIDIEVTGEQTGQYDTGTTFLCEYVIMNHHKKAVRDMWDQFRYVTGAGTPAGK